MTAVEEKSIPELAMRHVDSVYASALRQVRDPQMAADVTQAVFLVLLRKQSRLNARTILPVWLLRVTHYACLDAAKQARRRSHHEKKAAIMRAEIHAPMQPSTERSSADAPGQSAALWAAAIDEALDRLREADRSAIVLTYLEGLSHKELARRLRISEAAAHKRVQRAVSKLRKALSRRGASLSAGVAPAALASLMHPPAAPAAVIHAVKAVSSLKASAFVQALAGKTLLLIKVSQMKMLTILLALICGGAIATEMAVTAAEKAPAPATRPAAPATTRAASPFAPTIELVLHDGDWVDLGKGKISPPPPPNAAEQESMVESLTSVLDRGDLSFAFNDEYFDLMGIDLMVAPMSSDNFDLDSMPENNIKALLFATPARPAMLSMEGRLPKSFVVKTRDGSVGFLQIAKFDAGGNPPARAPAGGGIGGPTGEDGAHQGSVTIRFKFLQPEVRDRILLQVAVSSVFTPGQTGFVPSILDEMKKASKARDGNKPADFQSAWRVIAKGMACLDPLMHGTKWGKEIHDAAQLAQQMADNSGNADGAAHLQMGLQGVTLERTLNDLVSEANQKEK